MKHLFFTLLLFSTTAIFAQNTAYTTKKTTTEKALRQYSKGMEWSMKNDFEKALKAFSEACQTDNKFVDARIQKAACLQELNRLPEAETAFEEVASFAPDYDAKVWYVIATIEQKQDKYEEAVQHYELYTKAPKTNPELLRKAEKNLSDCQFAAQALRNPVPFNPQSLGDFINTVDFEYLPSLTADGETLIYTARVKGQEDFYSSKKMNGIWQKGTFIEGINTEGNEGAECISADGKTLIFTACNRRDGLGSCDLYFSIQREGVWSTPRNMGSNINSDKWESQPSLSADGRTLYFASTRNGGFGAADIWVAHLKNGLWDKPKNLGNTVNTAGDEISPFWSVDNKTLYFSSTGHAGMGDADLFVTRQLNDTLWEKPLNLGYPINTKNAEATLVVALDGKTAYYASDRKYDINATKKETDLYSFELPEKARATPATYALVTVKDAETKKALPRTRIDLTQLDIQKNMAAVTTDEKGEVLFCLPMGKNYSLIAKKEGYAFRSENFDLSENTSGSQLQPYKVEVLLQSIATPTVDINNPTKPDKPTVMPKPTPIVLKNVFFETNSAVLKKESIVELDNLYQLLSDNSNMKIEIQGHTDDIGSDSDNQLLSENRAKSVFQYLIKKGINSQRLTAKGYGETQPIDTNSTAEGKRNNRRTAFLIVL